MRKSLICNFFFFRKFLALKYWGKMLKITSQYSKTLKFKGINHLNHIASECAFLLATPCFDICLWVLFWGQVKEKRRTKGFRWLVIIFFTKVLDETLLVLLACLSCVCSEFSAICRIIHKVNHSQRIFHYHIIYWITVPFFQRSWIKIAISHTWFILFLCLSLD